MTKIADIAQELGVSTYTVSCALRGVGRTSKETTERVRAVADRLNYRPNEAARSMSTGRFNCVVLLRGTRDHKSTLPTVMLDGIQQTLAQHGIHLALSAMPDEQLTSADVMSKILDTQMCDGILVDYTHDVPEGFDQLLDHHKLPAVWLNRQLPLDAVYPDEYFAGYEITRGLLDRDHRHILYLDMSNPYDTLHDNHFSSREREAGYRKALSEFDAKPVALRSDTLLSFIERPFWLAQRLQQPDTLGATAIITYGDLDILQRVLTFLNGSLKLSQKLGVFADETWRHHDCAVVWKQPTWEVGSAAAELLLNRIEKQHTLLSRAVRGEVHFSPDVNQSLSNASNRFSSEPPVH